MRPLSGWRALGAAWIVVIAGAGGLAAVLQVLGPPASLASQPAHASEAAPASAPGSSQTSQVAKPAPEPQPATPAAAAAPAAAARAAAALATSPAGIAEPDPALLEPAPDFTGAQLPRISPDGRTSLRTYARAFDPADKRPRIAMVVVGFGLSASESKAALDSLPPAITVGISPYTHDRTGIAAAARATGHEFLVTLPMESQGYPLNDSGPRALLTGADPADNDRNLEWALSRIQGEVGVTGGSDGLLGERYAAATSAWRQVRDQLASRGLLYVDPRPGVPVAGAAVGMTMVVDDPPDRDSVDAKLALLERQARDTGTAVGLAVRVRPVTVERITAWARGLDGRGIDLVPVSALVPAAAPAAP